MSSIDPNLGLEHSWAYRESGWKPGMDANLKKLGAVVQLAVLSMTDDIPGTPSNGDRHIIPAGATGEWSGRTGQIAVRVAGAWEYYTPSNGWRAWVADEAVFAVYHDSVWRPVAGTNYGTGYGLRWNSVTDSYVLGIVHNGYFTPSPSLISFPVQEQMRRCTLLDNGAVNYYLDPTDSTLKEDGTTPSVLDGTDGQVMVEIPRFWFLQVHDGIFRYTLIGEGPFSLITAGGTVNQAAIHPAFYKGGSTARNYRYIGAYEASNASGNILASVSGVLPLVSQNRGVFRTRAAARGAGWHQYDNALHAAVQLLYLTEYGSFYAQNKIGAGVTAYAAWPGAPQALAGNSNAIGNATGNNTWSVPKWAATTAYALNAEVTPNAAVNGYTYRATVAGTSGGSEPTWPTTIGNTVVDGGVTWTCVRSQQYMSYRGIEHWWGHVWKFLDGANVHNSTEHRSRLYLSADHTAYADDTDTGYALAGLLPEANGYVTDFMSALGVWPSAVGGSSATYLTDYYYTQFNNVPDSGWRVALVGGDAHNGAGAGPFCVGSFYSSSEAGSNAGGRLCF